MPQRTTSWLVTDGPDAAVGQVAMRTLRGRLRAVWAEAHAAAEGTAPEHVHRLRVATRRTLAAFDVFRDVLPAKRAAWFRKRLRLLRRAAGEIRCYLNVCSHRHCLLTDRARGHADRIVCQYHGWEYAADGKVAKVPDGGCFKPFDRENARLQTFPVETCGDLVFVRLAARGPSLREHLGEGHDRVAAAFATPYGCNWRYAADFACNWKIPVENTVETYHLPLVHPTTLGGFGLIPEEAQRHWLEDRSTTLVFDLGGSGLRAGLVDTTGAFVAREAIALAAQPAGGTAECDPETWWQALCEATDRLAAAAPASFRGRLTPAVRPA
jgi:nitrite reductase/ring-hydroxylating ferredoxin subunit